MSNTNSTEITLNKAKDNFPAEDYLDEDKPLRHSVKKQNWCVISMLTPKSFPESKREQYKEQKVLGIKFRGVYEEYAEAAARAEHLQKIDKFHHVFVGEIGKWLPFDVDTDNMGAEDQVYREKSLNKYMKSYKDSLHEEELEEKQRKDDLLQGANVVTGKTSASLDPEVGVVHPASAPVVPPSTPAETPVQQSAQTVDDVTESLAKGVEEKQKLQEELAKTKESLVGLEDKLSTINDLYNKLKSN
jgi:hypothetical protein